MPTRHVRLRLFLPLIVLLQPASANVTPKLPKAEAARSRTRPTLALCRFLQCKQPQTPPATKQQVSSSSPNPQVDLHQEFLPRAPKSGRCARPRPEPGPDYAALNFFPPGVPDTRRTLADLRSLPAPHRRKPSRAPAILSFRSTTQPDERRTALSRFSVRDSSSRPSAADARTRAEECASAPLESAHRAATWESPPPVSPTPPQSGRLLDLTCIEPRIVSAPGARVFPAFQHRAHAGIHRNQAPAKHMQTP